METILGRKKHDFSDDFLSLLFFLIHIIYTVALPSTPCAGILVFPCLIHCYSIGKNMFV